MWYGFKLELVSYTNYSYAFLSLYEDTKFAIERLKTKNLIFVVKYGDHDLVLDQSFLNLVKFKQKYKFIAFLVLLCTFKPSNWQYSKF